MLGYWIFLDLLKTNPYLCKWLGLLVLLETNSYLQKLLGLYTWLNYKQSCQNGYNIQMNKKVVYLFQAVILRVSFLVDLRRKIKLQSEKTCKQLREMVSTRSWIKCNVVFILMHIALIVLYWFNTVYIFGKGRIKATVGPETNFFMFAIFCVKTFYKAVNFRQKCLIGFVDAHAAYVWPYNKT